MRMTIDERLQFLLTSTESLHSTAQEMTATIAADREANREAIAANALAIGANTSATGSLMATMAKLAEAMLKPTTVVTTHSRLLNESGL